MNSIGERIYESGLANPFNDSQGRNFSDKKIQDEFCPITNFWSLFNDHHEILLGSRGSGKTFLLKMMRRSMLAKIDDLNAKEIIEENQYIAFYIPLHMETVSSLSDKMISDDRKKDLFKFVFNSLLGESILDELMKYLSQIDDTEERAKKSYFYANRIAEVWFPNPKGKMRNLDDIAIKIRSLSYNFDYISDSIEEIIPTVFRRDFAAPLLAIQPIICEMFDIVETPTWILCVDEAEFVPVLFQKCMNSFMRSNTHGIAMKIGTLPFYWKTFETFDPNVVLSPENDFNYQILDLKPDSEDYRMLTNKLCAHRIKSRINSEWDINSLEDFLGTVGNDYLIDYYRDVVGEKKASKEQVIEDIINSFSDVMKENSKSYKNQEKTIHQKYAHILYVREIKKMCKGHFIPGWYAGADVIRKVSQGNPRLFIRIMSSMFSRALTNHFSTKLQHQVVTEFSKDFCEASQAIEVKGHEVYKKLDETAKFLQARTHDGPLISTGCSFFYNYSSDDEFNEWKEWLEKAIAFSRLRVSDEEIIHGITEKTVFTLSNAYAVNYWIPMRPDTPSKIPSSFTQNKSNKKKYSMEGQISFVEEK